jgi:hypothetical protein
MCSQHHAHHVNSRWMVCVLPAPFLVSQALLKTQFGTTCQPLALVTSFQSSGMLLIERFKAVVTATKCMCDMSRQRAFESPLSSL